jgi:hypothetical protein
MDIFQTDKLLQFWPNDKQTKREKMESSIRFIVYATLVAYAFKRDVRIVFLGLIVLVGIYAFYKVKSNGSTSPTSDNPMGNRLMHEENGTRVSDEEISQKLNLPSRWAERQFYTMPENDLGSYLKSDGRGVANCREDQNVCSDETNPRHPEWVQLRGTFGAAGPGGGPGRS